MADTAVHPALQRILASRANADAFAALTDTMSGADLTTFLLGVFAARAEHITSADVLRQYQQDRFVAPAHVDALQLARLEASALEIASTPTDQGSYEPVALAPVAPLGTHVALGGVPQNNVVSTARLSEVTADPTNSLALEAAVRRLALLKLDPRSGETVDLASVHRVVRAQHFDGPRSFAHFSLLGLVNAGRDQGNHSFEINALERQISVLVRLVKSVTLSSILIRLTPFNNELAQSCDDLATRLTQEQVVCDVWPGRDHGRGYYRSIGFKLSITLDDEIFELGDGGDVWWTQDLVQSRKERLVIGGLGLERLAMLLREIAT